MDQFAYQPDLAASEVKQRGSRRTALLIQLLLLLALPAFAAYTEPRFALLRVTALHSSTGSTSLRLEGTYNFADVVQLNVPLHVVVQQGATSARADLAGNVLLSLNGAAEQPVSGAGVVSVLARQILLVLPPGFTPGLATVQLVARYDGKDIASNRIGVEL